MTGPVVGAARVAGRFVLRAALAAALLCLVAVGIGPLTGRYRTVTVLTDSMRPGMPAGSMAVLVPVDPSSVREGDVITYQAPIDGQPVVTHRVTEVLVGGAAPVLRTRGDASAADDPWTARIEGSPMWRRVAVVPHAGTAIRAVRSPVAQHIAVKGAPAFLFLGVLASIWSRGGGVEPTAVQPRTREWTRGPVRRLERWVDRRRAGIGAVAVLQLCTGLLFTWGLGR